MYLSRVKIKNLRNFSAVDVKLAPNVVLLGENRAGKSNFLFALRLVLDASLTDRARQLRLSDIYDGCDLAADPEVRVDLDFSDWGNDPALVALLTDHRPAEDHAIARLSYVFRKKAEVEGPPKSEGDFEFKFFGGGDETRAVRPEVRRRISLDILHALRDAEAELGTWRSSPLRPLLEDALASIEKDELAAVADKLNEASSKLTALAPVTALEASIRNEIEGLSGDAHDIKAKLAFAPSDPLRVFRSIALFIDEGRRNLTDASLGSANLAFLALKLAEFSWRRKKNERNYTVLCVEEPEAHLHPQLQRRIFNRLFGKNADPARAMIITTHSPNIASVVSLKSVVLLRAGKEGTTAHALAHLPVQATDLEDLQRYLNTSRADIFFSRGVIFVEGDAEEALLPAFALSMGHDLDDLGITVVNVGGVNFSPYVKLAAALQIPFSVITDWDPIAGKTPLGIKRALDINDAIRVVSGLAPISRDNRAKAEAWEAGKFRAELAKKEIYLNDTTLEVAVANTPGLLNPLIEILEAEQFGSIRRGRLERWKTGEPVDGEQLLAMIADIGKGRLSGRLLDKIAGIAPPQYIADAIKSVIERA